MWKCKRCEPNGREHSRSSSYLHIFDLGCTSRRILVMAKSTAGKKAASKWRDETDTLSPLLCCFVSRQLVLFIVHLPLSAQCNRALLQRCQTNTSFPLRVLIHPTCQRRNCDNGWRMEKEIMRTFLLKKNRHQINESSKELLWDVMELTGNGKSSPEWCLRDTPSRRMSNSRFVPRISSVTTWKSDK